MKNIAKSIFAVFAGFITVAVLSVATDSVLELLGVFPSIDTGVFAPWMLVVALTYRSIYTVVGGCVTATLARSVNPMKAVLALSIIGLIGGLAGLFVGWDLSERWYPIAIAITAFPLTYLGGRLQIKK